MAWMHPDAVEYQRQRWTRPDANRWLKPDPERWLSPEELRLEYPELYERKYGGLRRPTRTSPLDNTQSNEADNEPFDDPEVRRLIAEIKLDLLRLRYLYKANFNRNQPRVPAGNPDGGQWTSDGGNGGLNDRRIISDVTPTNDWRPGAQYAANRGGRGNGPIRIGERLVEPTPGQAARLAAAQSRAHERIARVRELDPNWKPRPSTYETVDGLIRTYEAEAREAQARIDELSRHGIGPGSFAGGSIPARGPERSYYTWETEANNRNGNTFGCHTCGTFNPGTRSRNWFRDHQDPSALNTSGRQQRLYPQCASCSAIQGGWVNSLIRSR